MKLLPMCEAVASIMVSALPLVFMAPMDLKYLIMLSTMWWDLVGSLLSLTFNLFVLSTVIILNYMPQESALKGPTVRIFLPHV